MKIPAACALVLLALSAMALQATDGDSFDIAAFDAAATSLHNESGAPGMAVAVLQNGETLFSRGFGIAGPDDQAVTSQTVFQIGSITKSFVALVILQLASEGKLGLDDPVIQYLPTFRTASGSMSERITVDHLVTHRSGLTTLDGNRFGSAESSEIGPASAVGELANAELYAEPGTAFQYSNANYVILSHLIEVLDNRPFEQALETRIFEPLGMTHTFVGKPPSDAIAVATAYRLWFGVPVPRRPVRDQELDRRTIGAGGISSNVEDMAHYLEAVRSRDPRVVPDESDRQFAIHPFLGDWGYAYGWFSDSSGGEPFFEHSGFTPGFFTLATIAPASGHVVVVLTNMSGLAHGDLPRAVTNAALGWEPVPPAAGFGPSVAIWSAVAAPLGLLILLFRTGRRLLHPGKPMRLRERGLNIAAAAGLVAGVFAVYAGFPVIVGVGFSTGYSFFPDFTVTVVVTMALALLLAGGRLAVVVRCRKL